MHFAERIMQHKLKLMSVHCFSVDDLREDARGVTKQNYCNEYWYTWLGCSLYDSVPLWISSYINRVLSSPISGEEHITVSIWNVRTRALKHLQARDSKNKRKGSNHFWLLETSFMHQDKLNSSYRTNKRYMRREGEREGRGRKREKEREKIELREKRGNREREKRDQNRDPLIYWSNQKNRYKLTNSHFSLKNKKI